MFFGRKNQTITGVDIGTSSIKVLTIQQKPEQEVLEVLSQQQEVSSGVRKGVVIEADKVSGVVSKLLKRTQEELKRPINSIYVNIGGSHIFSTSSRGLVSVSRADRKISEEDINRVLQAAQTFSLPSNKEILEVFPKEFIVDEEGGVKNAVGMEGVRLEVDALVLCGFSPYIKNSTQAVLNSGVRIDDMMISSLASARSILTPREKELGVALLDIGAGTSDLAVFEEGNLAHLAVIPIGSGNITNDIAICLKTDIDTAEDIKIKFGSCASSVNSEKPRLQRGREKISRQSGSPPTAGKNQTNEENLVFSQKSLRDIIEARVSEIFEQANRELKKAGRQGLLPAGVVLTGGGSKLRKIEEIAKKEFKLPCRVGRPRGFSFQQQDPALAVVCGLVLREFDFEEEKSHPYPSSGFGSRLKKIFRVFIP